MARKAPYLLVLLVLVCKTTSQNRFSKNPVRAGDFVVLLDNEIGTNKSAPVMGDRRMVGCKVTSENKNTVKLVEMRASTSKGEAITLKDRVFTTGQTIYLGRCILGGLEKVHFLFVSEVNGKLQTARSEPSFYRAPPQPRRKKGDQEPGAVPGPSCRRLSCS